MTAAELEIVIKAEVQNAISNLSKVDKALVKTGQAANKVAVKGKADFTNFSRVIQDLPFGFTAISNNLTQLIPGVGALGLAFSAVVAAITFAQIGFRAWTGSTKEAKAATDEFGKSIKSATAGAIETGVTLQAYINIAKDDTKTQGERNYALAEANKLMGEHGEKLTLANVATKAITEQTEKFTQALIAEAVAGKYADKIADLIIKQKDASLAYGVALSTYNKVAKQTADINKNTFSGGTGGVGGLGNVGAINKARSAFSDASTAADTYKGITKELSQTTANFNENISKSVSLFGEIGTKTKEATKETKKLKEAQFKTFDPNIVKTGFDPKAFFGTENVTAEIQKTLDRGPSLKFPPFDFDKTAVAMRAAELGAIVRDTLVNGLAGIGEAIGNLISGTANPFSALFNIIGGGIKALGKQMIEYAVLQKIMLTALSSLNPFVSAAVGVALIALGSVISNMGAVQKFASGGVVTQPTLALVGERGPERITPLGYEGAAGNMMTGAVQFVIRGQDLYGTLNRFNQGNRNIN